MRQSGMAVALLTLLLLVAYLIYTFDPWVGIAAGVAVLVVAAVLTITTRTGNEPKKRTFSSDLPWDEEEPVDTDRSER